MSNIPFPIYHYPPKQGPLLKDQSKTKLNEINPFNFDKRYNIKELEINPFEIIFNKEQSISDIRIQIYNKHLEILSKCKCCDRHQINKPKKLQKWINYQSKPSLLNVHCTCDCRHRARNICRMICNNY